MKILHTADWHLGQRLCDRDREQEHEHFLQWLLQQLQIYPIDALIIAGDIFDVGNPPNYALAQYYNFLREARLYCPNIIVIGGNHDSPATLNAPQLLLSQLNIHVIGKAKANLKDQIIPIHTPTGEIMGMVAAVPFLRSGDIRKATIGETYSEKVQQIKQGIKQYYQQIADLSVGYWQSGLPIIGTGHLTALGSALQKTDISDVERDIYIGNQGNVGADIFPDLFSYVALGHIHKPKLVNKGVAHIRYSGSPIPLSFSERKDNKQVLLIEYASNLAQPNIEVLPVPLSRRLLRFKGNFDKVAHLLKNFEAPDTPYTTWAEVHIELDKYEANIDKKVKDMVEKLPIEILTTRAHYKNRLKSLDEQLDAHVSLDELKPHEVFEKKCESLPNLSHTDRDLLRNTFNELMENHMSH